MGDRNGFSYSNFYKAEKHTAALLADDIAERGLSTEGEAISAPVRFDCQTRAGYVQSELDRNKRMAAEYAARYTKALFMTVWRPSTRSAEHSCGIRQG